MLYTPKTLKGHENYVRCIVKLNENQLASGSGDNTIRIWDLIGGNCLKTLKGHESVVRCIVKLNENQLASGSADNTIRIWDIYN